MAEERQAADAALPSNATRVEWYETWEETNAKANKLARRDRDYYDGKQWTADEIAKLQARGQPVYTHNLIAKKVNTILGEEIERRIDPVARPRNPDVDADDASAATDALRYVEEEQKFDSRRSAVLANMIVEGYGGALKLVEKDGEDRQKTDDNGNPVFDADGEPVIERADVKHVLRHIEWDRLGYDPHSRAPDFSDAKYRFIILWMDLDDAIDTYPDAEDKLRAAVTHNQPSQSDSGDDVPREGWSDGKRQRVKLVEMYFRVGKIYYKSTFTKGFDIEPTEPVFLLDEKGLPTVCPLKMASCYVDAEGKRRGVVRDLISPQDEVNKRSSKALHEISVNGVIAEEDTIPDPEKFMAELAKPDGFSELAFGALAEKRVQIRDGRAAAAAHLQMLQEAKQSIDGIGPAAATLPGLPESASGRAQMMRKKSANTENRTFFDHLSAFTHEVFTADWLTVRMYWTEQKWLRVTDDQELTGYRFVALNHTMTRAERLRDLLEKKEDLDPQQAVEIAAGEHAPIILADVARQHELMTAELQKMAQQFQGAQQQPPPQLQQQLQQLDSPEHKLQLLAQHPLMQEQVTLNQVAKLLVDIVIDDTPDTAVLAQEEFATLSELAPAVIQARPDLAPEVTKLLIQASDLPKKRELLELWDKGPDPQQAQMQQQVQALQMALQQAQVQVAESTAQFNAAKAQAEQAKAEIAAAKAPSEIEENEASALRDASAAGNDAGGLPPGAF